MVIDLNDVAARLQLQAIRDRIDEHEIANDIAQGTWRPADDFLLPAPGNNTRKEAWHRCLRQMQTLGPRIMGTKLAAALGSVTWGGDNAELDEDLTALDIHAIARRMGNQLVVDGITAGLAHPLLDAQGNATGETRITRLGGYLQPYTDPMDVDQVVGLYQAWSHSVTNQRIQPDTQFDDNPSATSTSRWTVRIYDWSDGEENASIREWRNLRDPTHVGGSPAWEIESNAPVPRFATLGVTNDGLPIGEILQAAPQLMALWATEARLTLSEEIAAFPMPILKGGAEYDAFGPAEPIALDSDGSFEWSSPGQLEELRKQRQLRLERVREDLALPGGFLGNDSPSGEAFREANVRFRQSSSELATTLERMMTRLVMDYADLIEVEPAAVSISPSMEYEFAERAQWVIQLYGAGLVPLSVAARELQPYFGTWDDEALNEWIEQQEATVSVDDLRALAAGDE